MGYHLIVLLPGGAISTHYAESFEELCQIDGISKDSIIYKAAKEWKPSVVGDDPNYKLLAEDWYRAGIRAQNMFFEEAKQAKLIPEKISQDPASFSAYTAAVNSRVKRGDYLLRAKNIEVEVKCVTIYSGHYYLQYADIKAHENMQIASSVPVWLAIYERQGGSPAPGSLQMISVKDILLQNNKGVNYDKDKQCLVIPIKMTSPGFTAIE